MDKKVIHLILTRNKWQRKFWGLKQYMKRSQLSFSFVYTRLAGSTTSGSNITIDIWEWNWGEDSSVSETLLYGFPLLILTGMTNFTSTLRRKIMLVRNWIYIADFIKIWIDDWALSTSLWVWLIGDNFFWLLSFILVVRIWV